MWGKSQKMFQFMFGFSLSSNHCNFSIIHVHGFLCVLLQALCTVTVESMKMLFQVVHIVGAKFSGALSRVSSYMYIAVAVFCLKFLT